MYSVFLHTSDAYVIFPQGDVTADNSSACKDGLEAALEAWVGLLHSAVPPAGDAPITGAPPTLLHGSTHLFQAMLRVRLAPPDGTR